MTEQPVKKRGWVKNAAIVFLAVLLVLTFFSNTIMNISLPEVSTAVVQGGSITEAVSGSGTITANSVYEVKIEQTRTVESLMVRTGDTVAEGDVLFTLKGETPDLDAAEKALQQVKDSYQQTLLNSTSKTDKLELERLQQNINDLKAERDLAIQKNNITGVTLDKASAELALADATRAETTAQGNFDAAQKAMIRDYPNTTDGLATSFGPPATASKSDEDTLVKAVDVAQASYDTAEDNLSDAEDAYDRAVAALDTANSNAEPQRTAYEAALQAYTTAYDNIKDTFPGLNITGMTKLEWIEEQLFKEKTALSSAEALLSTAMSAVTSAQSAEDTAQLKVASARTALDNAENALDTAEDALSKFRSESSDYNSIMRPYLLRVEELNRLQQILTDAKAAKQKAQDALTSITGGIATYDEQIKQAEKALVDKQIQVEKNTSSLNLSASKDSRAVAEAQAALDKLVKDGLGTSVTAPVAGVVKELNVTPGQEITPMSSIPAKIEMPENGYYLKFAVTNAQAQNLRPGVEASEINNWWGVKLRYTLANISNDPDNQQSKKMLLFTVSGDEVSSETGRQHTLEIGAPAGNYDLIVPKTAMHTDAQGDFVLLLQQKSTPLGTRFIAARVDVNILAEDNTNAAISGGLSSWDYVITVSSAPVEAGQYVRLAE
ncbi:MAG: HlyD family efflux transporter periplasmic adaptor subunit [Oscillospiraceae bacterium]|jgi:multidrug efflux pump subunit AcrA (membrane-fusion protein)|nr:HlyD family efflux transporter periplasmic adaptor subunit [Oscillospiraceae bacterium]